MSDVVAAPAAPAAAPATSTAIDALATKAVAGKGAPEAPAPAAPKASAPDLFEVTVSGRTEKVTLEDLKRGYSLKKGSELAFEEKAKLSKQNEEIMSNIRDPKRLMKFLTDPKLGLNKDEVKAEFENWYKAEYIDREAMTPEQRDLADAKARIAAFEEKEANEKAELERIENEKADTAEAQRVTQEIMELIPKSGLPKTKFTASRLAYWMRVNESKGIKAPPELLIQKVKDEARGIMDSMLQSSDGEVLFNLLGEPTAKKLQRYNLEKLRAAKGLPPKPVVPEPDAPREQLERITEADVKRRSRDLFR